MIQYEAKAMHTGRLAAATALLLVQSCVAGADSSVSADCVAVVHFGGVTFAASGTAFDPASAADQVGATTKNVGCDDTGGEPVAPLANGESNFLPPGTALYRINGYLLSERLAARVDTSWTVMVATAAPRD